MESLHLEVLGEVGLSLDVFLMELLALQLVVPEDVENDLDFPGPLDNQLLA